jgi:hypothetical protein
MKLTRWFHAFKKFINEAKYCPLDEITIKGAKGAKVKVLFQGLHMTCVIFTLVHNLKFYISDTPFNTTF